MEYQKLLMKLRASCQIKLPNYRNSNDHKNPTKLLRYCHSRRWNGWRYFCGTMSETTSKSSLTILVVEATSASPKDSTESNFDSRSTALSFGSKEILGESSIWLDLCKNAEAIRSINVSIKVDSGRRQFLVRSKTLKLLGLSSRIKIWD